MANQEKGEVYLLIMSILLGVSFLKLTEVFELGSELKRMIELDSGGGLTVTIAGIFVLICAYVVYFFYLFISTYAVYRYYNMPTASNTSKIGSLIGKCIFSLALLYIVAFFLAINGIKTR